MNYIYTFSHSIHIRSSLKFIKRVVYIFCFVQKMLHKAKSLCSKDIKLFICISVFAPAFLLFLLRYSVSRPPYRRRFLGVSVAGNRRNRFFCSTPRRAISPSLSISLFLPLCRFSMFFPLFPHPVRFRQSDAVLRRETGNDRLNSAIIAGDFASTLQT